MSFPFRIPLSRNSAWHSRTRRSVSAPGGDGRYGTSVRNVFAVVAAHVAHVVTKTFTGPRLIT